MLKCVSLQAFERTRRLSPQAAAGRRPGSNRCGGNTATQSDGNRSGVRAIDDPENIQRPRFEVFGARPAGDTVSHRETRYRCFLPDLAGFTGADCTAPLEPDNGVGIRLLCRDSPPAFRIPNFCPVLSAVPTHRLRLLSFQSETFRVCALGKRASCPHPNWGDLESGVPVRAWPARVARYREENSGQGRAFAGGGPGRFLLNLKEVRTTLGRRGGKRAGVARIPVRGTRRTTRQRRDARVLTCISLRRMKRATGTAFPRR